MRVIAKFEGFYGGSRRRVGAEFDMDESKLPKDKDGKPVLPKWVVECSAESRKALSDAALVRRRRDLKAAEVSAGPKRPGVKAVTASPGDELV